MSIDIPVDDYITFQHDTTFPAIKRWLHDADYTGAIPENTTIDCEIQLVSTTRNIRLSNQEDSPS